MISNVAAAAAISMRLFRRKLFVWFIQYTPCHLNNKLDQDLVLPMEQIVPSSEQHLIPRGWLLLVLLVAVCTTRKQPCP